MKHINPIAIALLLFCAAAHSEYTAWLMVMWPNGIKEPYMPLKSYRGYDQCTNAIKDLALAGKLPKGVKVDCIDKNYGGKP